MHNENEITTVRGITEYLQNIDYNKDFNIENSSIRQYHRNGLIGCKYNSYKRPFKYKPSNRGVEQIYWFE